MNKTEKIAEQAPDLEGIKSIKMTLLSKKSDPNKQHKADYAKKATATFIIPDNFPREEDYFEKLLTDMYKDLLLSTSEDFDSIGLWVEYDTIEENAMSVDVLTQIKEYSPTKINPLYEFFKMTARKRIYNTNNENQNE